MNCRCSSMLLSCMLVERRRSATAFIADPCPCVLLVLISSTSGYLLFLLNGRPRQPEHDGELREVVLKLGASDSPHDLDLDVLLQLPGEVLRLGRWPERPYMFFVVHS